MRRVVWMCWALGGHSKPWSRATPPLVSKRLLQSLRLRRTERSEQRGWLPREVSHLATFTVRAGHAWSKFSKSPSFRMRRSDADPVGNVVRSHYWRACSGLRRAGRLPPAISCYFDPVSVGGEAFFLVLPLYREGFDPSGRGQGLDKVEGRTGRRTRWRAEKERRVSHHPCWRR